jgi:hypothetical protein
MLFATACDGGAHPSRSDGLSEGRSVRQGALTSTSRSQPPLPERRGTEAPVVWRSVPDTTQRPGNCSQRSDTLEVTEVRADADTIFFDTTYESVEPGTKRDGVSAELFVRVDGCAIRPPRLSGTVWRDWAAGSTLSVPRISLPDGELDITLRVFGAERSLAFEKRGKVLRSLASEQRPSFRFTPADPTTGASASLGIPLVQCPGEGS